MDPLIKLGFNIQVFIAQVVNFGLLLLLLRLFAYKPIMRMLDNRAAKIKESLVAGEMARAEAVQAEQEVAKRIEESSRDGQKIVDQAVQAGEEVRRKATQEAKKEAEGIMEKARVEIKREQEESLNELRKGVADLAVVVAGRAIGRSLDEKTQRQLIEDALKEASTLKAN
jgi:F-type H+-transporting ATPase subunit b